MCTQKHFRRRKIRSKGTLKQKLCQFLSLSSLKAVLAREKVGEFGSRTTFRAPIAHTKSRAQQTSVHFFKQNACFLFFAIDEEGHAYKLIVKAKLENGFANSPWRRSKWLKRKKQLKKL